MSIIFNFHGVHKRQSFFSEIHKTEKFPDGCINIEYLSDVVFNIYKRLNVDVAVRVVGAAKARGDG